MPVVVLKYSSLRIRSSSLISPFDDSILRCSSGSLRETAVNSTVDFLSPMIVKTRVSFPIIWTFSGSSSGRASCPHVIVEERKKQIMYEITLDRVFSWLTKSDLSGFIVQGFWSGTCRSGFLLRINNKLRKSNYYPISSSNFFACSPYPFRGCISIISLRVFFASSLLPSFCWH